RQDGNRSGQRDIQSVWWRFLVREAPISCPIQPLITDLLNLFSVVGGYEKFSLEYPEFCSQTKSLATLSSPVPTTIPEPPELGSSSCGTPLHDQGGPVEILPFLYLGSAQHAARRDTLDALGITALLNVSLDCPNHFEAHYQYKCIPVEDNHKADIGSWFLDAIEFIGMLVAWELLLCEEVLGWECQGAPQKASRGDKGASCGGRASPPSDGLRGTREAAPSCLGQS
uniref:protein-tyrosine-phosphatase n=1 Tax=Monodelphis domestica TaxID=13616 RepID=F7C617_MONDO